MDGQMTIPETKSILLQVAIEMSLEPQEVIHLLGGGGIPPTKKELDEINRISEEYQKSREKK